LSVALGFAGLAMVTLQFVLTARFKVVKAPYGSDIVYYFHR
jgi:predicted ferric reductase